MTEYDTVVFDLDDTLCVSDQTDEEIHRRVFDRVDAEPFFELEDMYAVDVASLPEADSERRHWRQVYRAVADRVSADPEPALLRALADATVEVLDPAAVSFRPGARAALADARERFAVGLLTNGTADRQSRKLERLGIGDAFAATVFCGPGTGIASKPDPEPFRRVLDALDARPGTSVYVGDRLDGDVRGAHNAGMASVWVPTGGAAGDATPAPEPIHRIDTPGDLPSVL
ncbi:HAD family hydrolase [Halobaculum sp. EA56]|uniref:HAD family hydrolase n=1 Tax=Halobaculum sp. EA56 TaxID=3421648 RepID=UPI003EC0B123